MISLGGVLAIHKIVIQKFGGSDGVRNIESLKSALARPYQTFDGIDLYPTAIDKAAAVFESVISNHPFIDGNKRTGYILMRLVLLHAGDDIKVSENEKYSFVVSCAEGKLGLLR